MSILLELQVGGARRVRRGIDHYWAVIQKIGADGNYFTVTDIVDLSDVNERRVVSDFTQRLVKGCYIKCIGERPTGGKPAALYKLISPQDETPALTRDGSPGRQGRGQQQMWNVIRKGIAFTPSELAIQASTDEVKVSVNSAKRYAQALDAAGYLSVRDPGGPGRQRTYRIKPAMNTGPRPPAILQMKAVWDQNRNEIVGRVLAEEEPS